MIPRKSNGKLEKLSLPKNDIAILGILYESIRDYNRSLTGKEVNNVIELANYKYWVDIEFSTAYNCLKRLEKQGLVEGKYSKRNNRRVKLFHLTKKGERQLFEEIQDILSFIARVKNPIDIGIKNLFILSKDLAVSCLKRYKEDLERSINYYERMVNGLKQGKPGDLIDHIPITAENLQKIPLVLALFERPYIELKARRTWLNKFLDAITSKEIDW